MKKLTTRWFFSEPSPILRFFLIYVKGDMIVLIPLIALIFLTYLISFKYMIVMIGLYIALRYFVEIIYWLFQQFGPKKYRPYDYGLKNLDNHAIYIIYQLTAFAGMLLGAGIALYAVLYLR